MTDMKRKIIIIVCAALALAALGTGITVAVIKRSKTQTIPLSEAVVMQQGRDLKLVAHRGFSAREPENTLQSVAAAASAGFYACEFDIHCTADCRWIVMHDGDISRTTNGRGEISEMTYDEILQYYINAGNGIDKYEKGSVAVPLLEQVLDVLAQSETIPEIEIKGATNQELDNLLEILNSRGIAQSVIIIDFDLERLKYLRSKDETLTLLHLTGVLDGEEIDSCVAAGMTGVAFNGNEKKNLDFIPMAFEKGLTVASWTIDDKDAAQALYDLGVGYITTNKIYP